MNQCPIEIQIGPCAVKPEDYPAGERRKETVSSTARVMRGEFVQQVTEYIQQGQELRWGNEDVHILAAEPLSRGRTGVVFVQGGVTKFKVLALDNGDLALGNALALTDEALPAASLVSLTPTRCVVVYNPECSLEWDYKNHANVYFVQMVELDGRTATLGQSYTMGTNEKYAPYNITACRINDTEIAVCFCQGNQGNTGEAMVGIIRIENDRWYTTSFIRVDLPNDVDEYAGAWSIQMVSETAAVVSCFSGYDQPIAFAVIDMEGININNRQLRVRCIGHGKYAASMPCSQVVALPGGVFGLVYGIAWLSADKTVVKSTVALEIWALTRYAAELLWYGCEDTRYQAAVGGISALATAQGLAVSYVVDNTAHNFLVRLGSNPQPGPVIAQGTVDAFVRVVPIGPTRALEVLQRGGCGYVRLLESVDRVIPTHDRFDGVALTGGEAGDTVTVVSPS